MTTRAGDAVSRMSFVGGRVVVDKIPAGQAPATDHLAVVHGVPEEDRPSAWAPEIVRRLPQGREVVLPELSHFGPLEDPAAVAASVLAAFGGDPAALS